jgi:hypothetical protein
MERMDKEKLYITYSKELCLQELKKLLHDQDSSQVLSKYYHITA